MVEALDGESGDLASIPDSATDCYMSLGKSLSSLFFSYDVGNNDPSSLCRGYLDWKLSGAETVSQCVCTVPSIMGSASQLAPLICIKLAPRVLANRRRGSRGRLVCRITVRNPPWVNTAL